VTPGGHSPRHTKTFKSSKKIRRYPMSSPVFLPMLSPRIVERIADSITYLELPAEALLLQAYGEMLRQRDARRNAVRDELERVLAEGRAAMSRLLLDADAVRKQRHDDYFSNK
jgi:hypothetical protein